MEFEKEMKEVGIMKKILKMSVFAVVFALSIGYYSSAPALTKL